MDCQELKLGGLPDGELTEKLSRLAICGPKKSLEAHLCMFILKFNNWCFRYKGKILLGF